MEKHGLQVLVEEADNNCNLILPNLGLQVTHNCILFSCEPAINIVSPYDNHYNSFVRFLVCHSRFGWIPGSPRLTHQQSYQ